METAFIIMSAVMIIIIIAVLLIFVNKFKVVNDFVTINAKISEIQIVLNKIESNWYCN